MTIEFLDPDSVHVPPNRQRSKLDIDDLLPSIKRFGVLNPIIVKRAPGVETPILVAGGRRLSCTRELGIKVPARDFSDLSPFEHRCIELEENIKRKDLPWRDAVKAIGNIHTEQTNSDPSWTQSATAEALSFSANIITIILTVYAKLDDPRLADCTSYREAYNVLVRQAERRTAGIVNEIVMEGLGDLWERPFVETSATQTSVPPPMPTAIGDYTLTDINPSPPPIVFDTDAQTFNQLVPTHPTLIPSSSSAPSSPILNQDFLTWDFVIPYKFNLIHVDFPYGVNAADAMLEGYENTKELYWNLTDYLLTNQDRFISYSAHCIFWLNMRYFEETRRRFGLAGWKVLPRPLIWHKSDGRGSTTTDGKQPRHTYEAALFMFRGERPLVKQIGDSYAAPNPDKPIHPTQKPGSVLSYFLSGVVDSNTEVFDPTAGSGSALLAAEELGAKTIYGLEINPEFCSGANEAIQHRRNIRTLRGE